MKINYNYHTHTYLCSHAVDMPEEYIKRAIENNIEYMGFSDHIPLEFDDGAESGYRVPTKSVTEYFTMIRNLREKYKDKINIKIGFEMEYYPEYFEKMLKYAINYGAEYLILGQHFLCPENLSNTVTSSCKNNSIDDIKKYVKLVVEAIKTGVFSYVAHPDIFNFIGQEDIYAEEMKKICVASREYNIPLEINCLGIRDNRHYPNEKFWTIAGKEACPVTIGFDAHDAFSAYDKKSLEICEKIINKFSLNYIGMPDIKLHNAIDKMI